MATNYRLEPPAGLSSAQLTALDAFADEHPRTGRIPQGKADSAQKLITVLDKNEGLSVEVRSALSVESICLPLVLEAINEHPGEHPSALDAQMANVLKKVGAVPEYPVLINMLNLDQTEGTFQRDTLSCARPCAVHGIDIDWKALPDPADNIDRRNIRAAGQLCRIRIVGDAMKVFSMVDTLRDTHWNSKSFDPQNRDLCNSLYCWGEDRKRVPLEARNGLVATVIGGANTAFIPRWNEFVDAISAYMDSANANSTAVRKPDLTPVHTAAFALQANLDSAVTGIIRMQINDCAAQLDKAIKILKHREVVERFGAGRAQNWWSVRASINLDSSTADLKPNFDNAQAIGTIFDWLEHFPELTDDYKLDNPNNQLFPAISVIRHPHNMTLPVTSEVLALSR